MPASVIFGRESQNSPLNMNRTLPKNLNEAVAFGIALLDETSKAELASLEFVDPHTSYCVDFIEITGSNMGLFDFSNKVLLEDIANNHSELLHFLELIDGEVDPNGAIRVILAAMARHIAKS
ncbi:hypothetical protein [Massilia sp. BJB1822]|uniref:hypothetical protein n=1 Tax=Massilia sp. BJB1822 TaxID=2744470 RepID=UPI001592BAE6|nr:hypothetical protein [Massilia sp. BJB1822]NVD97549.1 hypothetical protein [Massilia sp. BJB1822]